MRAWVLVVLTGCEWGDFTPPPSLVRAEFRGDHTCSFATEGWVAVSPGCTVELALSLDPEKVRDPRGWSIETYTPTVFDKERMPVDADGRLTYRFTMPPQTEWREDNYMILSVFDADGDEQKDKDFTILVTSVVPAAAPPAFIWNSYWYVDGERVRNDGWAIDCSQDIRVVTVVGGNPTRAKRLDLRVFDVDLFGESTITLETAEVDGMSILEIIPGGDLCSVEEEQTNNNVDPAFRIELLDANDVVLDTREGYELDTDT